MKILCPTDFSAHSQVALEYAINLANTLDAEIHILSVFQVPKSSTSFVSLDEVIRKNNEEDMSKLIAGLGPLIKDDNLPISKVVKGATVKSILQYTDRNNIDLVVMGTQGSNSLRTVLFGSTTRAVAKSISTPVLAIPESLQYKLTNNRVILALDSKEIGGKDVVAVPVAIAKKLDLKIDIVHIQKHEEIIPFDPSISIFLEDTIGEVHIKPGGNAVAAIKEYAEDSNVGMLIMIRRAKSFFEKLLTVGDTSAELAQTNVPLMILPESV